MIIAQGGHHCVMLPIAKVIVHMAYVILIGVASHNVLCAQAQSTFDRVQVLVDSDAAQPSFSIPEMAYQIAPYVEYRNWEFVDSASRVICLRGDSVKRDAIDTFPRAFDRVAKNVQIGLMAWQLQRYDVNDGQNRPLYPDTYWALLVIQYSTIHGVPKFGLAYVQSKSNALTSDEYPSNAKLKWSILRGGVKGITLNGLMVDLDTLDHNIVNRFLTELRALPYWDFDIFHCSSRRTRGALAHCIESGQSTYAWEKLVGNH